jgi:16S rRNA (cytidine1402-2'-O)-methyltransferase
MKNTNLLCGSLYIVATPLGNLQDISLRAIETLKWVDCIAAEDTRHSQSLLQHYGISKQLISLHEHNERERALPLIERLREGQNIALISDAGTPLISDPGYVLVHQVRKMGIKVIPIPGACAAIAALSASGMPTDRFTFEGFLPTKSHARNYRLNLLKNETRTMVFYEAPHRILALLEELLVVFGGKRQAVMARELTKRFETIHSDGLQALIEWAKTDSNQQRGEIVMVVAGAAEEVITKTVDTELLLMELLKYLPVKTAAEIAANVTNEKKNTLYKRALELKKL